MESQEMSETHQAEAYSLVPLNSLCARMHTCHLCEKELVAQPPARPAGWQFGSYERKGCTWLWPPDKAASKKSCMKALMVQPTEPWGRHGAWAPCSPAGLVESTNRKEQPDSCSRVIITSICSVHLHLQWQQRSSGSQRSYWSFQRGEKKKKKQSYILMCTTCPSLVPLRCIKHLRSWCAVR